MQIYLFLHSYFRFFISRKKLQKKLDYHLNMIINTKSYNFTVQNSRGVLRKI